MSAPDPVAVSSNDARIDWKEDVTPDQMGRDVNDALLLIRNDIQRIAGYALTKNVTYDSGSYRVAVNGVGVANVWAVFDTATASSDGSNYHVVTLLRNGIAANSLTYDTRNAEIFSYQGGVYLGEVNVTIGDILSVDISVTGSPSPSLTTANTIIRYRLRETA